MLIFHSKTCLGGVTCTGVPKKTEEVPSGILSKGVNCNDSLQVWDIPIKYLMCLLFSEYWCDNTVQKSTVS